MALLVVLLPFVAFVLLAVVVPLRRRGQAAGAVSIAAIAVAFLAALFSWFVWKGDAHVQTWAWIPADEAPTATVGVLRSEEHTSELQSLRHLVCRPLLEKKQRPL